MVRVTLVPGQALSRDLVETWTRLQHQNINLSSPFFSPSFTQIVASTKINIEVAVIEEADGIKAFFPFERSEVGIGRPVGAGISDYHGLISSEEFRISPRLLLERTNLGRWSFDHLPISQRNFSSFHLWTESSPQIDLSGGFDAYVADRKQAGSEQIKKLGNLRRRLEREVGSIRLVPRCTDRSMWMKALSWKSAQYLDTGVDDILRVNWISQALELMFDERTEVFSGILSVLYAGDRPVAAHFGIGSAKTWHYWFPAYDPDLHKYSPGLLLLIEMASHAANLGVRAIDLGKGAASYKQRLSNAQSEVAVGIVEPRWRFVSRRAGHRMRMALVNSSISPAIRRIAIGLHGNARKIGRRPTDQ